MPVAEEKIREALKQVIDPELFVNIVDLGLIYDVRLADAEERQDRCHDRHDHDQPRLSRRPAADRQQ